MNTLIRTATLSILLLLGAAGSAVAATANGVVSVSAVILSKSNCLFNTSATTIPFGNLDPISGADVTVTANLVFVCRGSAPDATYFISDDDGLHESGPNNLRMQHATNLAAFIPYSLTLSTTSGTIPKNTPQTLTLTGKVRRIDYQTAIAGHYADTVTLSILP
jgi:spore coat protein U-like protein